MTQKYSAERIMETGRDKITNYSHSPESSMEKMKKISTTIVRNSKAEMKNSLWICWTQKGSGKPRMDNNVKSDSAIKSVESMTVMPTK